MTIEKGMRLFAITCLLAAFSHAAVSLSVPLPESCFEGCRDYTFMGWADGWRAKRKAFSVQTCRYGLLFNVTTLSLERLGAFESPISEQEALLAGNEPIENLPAASLTCKIELRGKVYTLSSSGKPEDCELIESGRWFQRRVIRSLTAKEGPLPATASLEIAAWPDRVAFLLYAVPLVGDQTCVLELKLQLSELSGLEIQEVASESDGARVAGVVVSEARPSGSGPASALNLEAKQFLPLEKSLNVTYDPALGAHRVVLRNDPQPEGFHENDRIERVKMKVANPTQGLQTLRLLFAKDDTVVGITGLSAMIRDRDGFPTGIPVQISKNWHRRKELSDPYQGPWYHGFTSLSVPPEATIEFEYTSVNGHWGGLPAVSHAQLCLVGWGTNQLWDQAALGSWGESICFDPDVNLQRSMIDDVRPLMVWQMNSTSPRKWAWTNNVGGGDFLVYLDPSGKRQWNSRMKTSYRRIGPNLSEVTYAGTTADRKIDLSCTAQLSRSDDYVRIIHRLRYDVREEAEFSRLAFFQLGADHYNDHVFGRMARGNAEGLIEEWEPERGGERYSRQGIGCAGESPWFSLHEGHSRDESTSGAWANRGFVIRSWRARLGGQESHVPFVSVYGTENGSFKSANVELAPPPGLTRMLPGDFVEATLVQLTLPQFAADYYGPNRGLQEVLPEMENSWRLVHREAAGNAPRITVTVGCLEGEHPIRLRAQGDRAEFALEGGLAYAPVTLCGLSTYREPVLEHKVEGVWKGFDQAVHGRDFWQTDFDPQTKTWEITWNVTLDSEGQTGAKRQFRFRMEP